MFTHVNAPAKPAAREADARTAGEDRPVTEHASVRPHLSSIVFGLVDAHVSGIDFFDTVGGDELARAFQARRAAHRAAHRATAASTSR